MIHTLKLTSTELDLILRALHGAGEGDTRYDPYAQEHKDLLEILLKPPVRQFKLKGTTGPVFTVVDTNTANGIPTVIGTLANGQSTCARWIDVRWVAEIEVEETQ